MKRLFLLLCLAPFALLPVFCSNAGTPATAATLTPSEGDTTARPTGAIAYIRNGAEIRLIDSNGGGDRLLWTHPNAKEPLGLFDLAWRPDGGELAFSSAHEAAYSLYHADLYAVRPDGSGFRRITNAPDRQGFKRYKKGTVTVTVRNNQYSFEAAQSSAGVFIINIAGSEEPQQVTLPPGASKTLTFKSVADFGGEVQPLVAIYGNYRWFMPGTDVQAGKTIKAPDFSISGDGIPYLGAFRPVWKADGSALSYRNGLCMVQTIPARPREGEVHYRPLFGEEGPNGTCTWDWGPTNTVANQLLYTENESEEGSGIYLMKEGGTHNPSARLALFSDVRYQIAHDLKWLPDGSGFLYSATNLMQDASNIFRYDLRTRQATPVTQLEGAFARRFCVSPSGQWIVYERARTPDDYEAVDLWMIRTDGTGEKLLVRNGLCPTWSR